MNPDDSHDAHQEAQQVLPWLANGTLAGSELERVQSHVHGCAACRADLAVLHTLRAAGADPMAGPAAGCDPERALARLLPQLDAAQAPPTPVPAADHAPPVARGWRTRLAANDRSWLRAAAAVQCCVIAVLAGLLLRPAATPDAPAGAYRVLGEGGGVQGTVVVAFQPDTPERELRRIVQASGAHVVGGPTVTGAWLLATQEAPAQVAARLRAEAAVTLAEPLGAEGRP